MIHKVRTTQATSQWPKNIILMLLLALTIVACRESENDTDNSSDATSPAATVAASNEEGTDNDSETIEPVIAAGFSISDPIGNTLTPNNTAQFYVKLIAAPTANVTIPVSSSDENEGKPTVTELIFTPENWDSSQIVTIRGTNENVVNEKQQYTILLGPAVSDDTRYQGLDPEDVIIRGVELLLAPPAQNLTSFVANVPAFIQPDLLYTGDKQLSYAIIQAPDGMTIDFSNGFVQWTPQASQQGQTHTVKLSVNDGSRFAETTFEVAVVNPTPLEVTVAGNLLTIVDDSTTLQGMTITQIEGTGALDQLNLGKLDTAAAPDMPAWAAALSDVLVMPGSLNQPIEVRIPLNNLGEGIALDDVDFFAYVTAEDADGNFWSPVFIETRYEGSSDDPTIVVSLGGLQGLSLWGYTITDDNNSSHFNTQPKEEIAAKTAHITQSQAATPTCVQKVGPAPDNDPLDDYVCTAAQLISSETVTSTVNIAGWGPASQTSRWGGMTKEQLVSYLLEAQLWFAANKLGYDKTFNVSIHPMDNANTLGYVTTGNSEQRKTIHLSNNESFSLASMQGTIVHEYIHHAQGHPDTKIQGNQLLIDQRGVSSWFIEGTARWFEDEIFDDLNTYKEMEIWGAKIAEAGIHITTSGQGTQRAYQRFSFFKLLTQACPKFVSNYRLFLNVDPATDASGIANLVTTLGNSGCNFGDHLGTDKVASLEAALVYYNYATQFEQKISLLDSNEPDDAYILNGAGYLFGESGRTVDFWTSQEQPLNLGALDNIPAAGAYSFKMPAVEGQLPEGKVAELVFEGSQDLVVSVFSTNAQFVGTNTLGGHNHTWFSTADKSSYEYNANGTLPELFVTVVNGDVTKTSTLQVTFQIRDAFAAAPTVTSHTPNQQVSNRVIQINGEIPVEARQTTTHVAITVNGIAASVPMNADGRYTAQAVMTLGQNLIRVQGTNGATPTTNALSITLEGVASTQAGHNALIASRVAFVLRWDTNNTDIDIYSTDKNNQTIWYTNRTVGPGNLDFDVQKGYGPEVISYRATGDDLYVNGLFELDVHYYGGYGATHFTLDVILNETEGGNLRVLRFESSTPLTQGNASGGAGGNGPASPASRFNDIVRISCSAEGICTLATNGYDTNVLTAYTGNRPQ